MNELEGNSNLKVLEALPLEEPLRRAIGLAEALRQMHREGAICGQLEPQHIVWDRNRVTLLPHETSATTPYSSPEQLRGENADARSDVFAFGAVAYELFSGHKAFAASDPAELKRQILEDAPAPLDGLSPQLAGMLIRCLEKSPGDRWQRMNSILIELKLLVATQRQGHSASEWRDRIGSLSSQLAVHERRLATHQATHETVDAELRRLNRELEEKLRSQEAEIARIHETQASIHESIEALRRGEQARGKAIEGLEAAATQTDEVVEHIVEAFGVMHQAMVERGESKILLVSRNGS